MRSRYGAWVKAKPDNLNEVGIDDDTGSGISLDTPPIHGEGITVYFRDIEQHLIRHIQEADAVLGCVAWLTNKSILEALSRKDPVAIVVQKEDFLRPDLFSRSKWNTELRRRYDSLSCSWMRYYLPGIVSHLSVCGDPTMHAVRCVGNYNRDKAPAFPRMHHKFVVLCRVGRGTHKYLVADGSLEDIEEPRLEPYAVWTGSFNFTENAGRSLENALYITNKDIVEAYADEWARIEALSEPLDWERDWVAPEWRIGT